MKISNTDIVAARLGSSEINTVRIGSQTVWAGGATFPTQTFTPEAYGAVGNGIADDTAAFVGMHAAILSVQEAAPSTRFAINFASGASYIYSWNRWMWGIRYLTVNGNGSSICNINNSGSSAHEGILRTNRDAFSVLPYNEIWGTTHFGYYINTATIGATSVTLKNPSDASNFSVGKVVLIASYSQQAGNYPPNARYFDWVVVTGISSATISFDRPLNFLHREDWPTGDDEANQITMARIVAAEREIPWTIEGKIRDLVAITNPNAGDYWGEIVLIEGFLSFELDNVQFPRWTSSSGGSLTFRNSSIPASEPDKILDFLRLENCNPAGFYLASGVNTIELFGCTLPGRNFFCGRNMHVYGCTFLGAETTWGALYIDTFAPTYSILVENSVFNGVNNSDFYPIADARSIFATIGQENVSLDGSDIVISGYSAPIWSGGGDYYALMNIIYEGAYVRLLNSSSALKGYGKILTIKSNGAMYTARITMSWTVQPSSGDRIQKFSIDSVIFSNTTWNNTTAPAWLNGVGYASLNGTILLDYINEF